MKLSHTVHSLTMMTNLCLSTFSRFTVQLRQNKKI